MKSDGRTLERNEEGELLYEFIPYEISIALDEPQLTLFGGHEVMSQDVVHMNFITLEDIRSEEFDHSARTTNILLYGKTSETNLWAQIDNDWLARDIDDDSGKRFPLKRDVVTLDLYSREQGLFPPPSSGSTVTVYNVTTRDVLPTDSVRTVSEIKTYTTSLVFREMEDRYSLFFYGERSGWHKREMEALENYYVEQGFTCSEDE